MVVDVIMKTNVRSFPYLNNAADTVLLNNVRKLGELVHSRTSYNLRKLGAETISLTTRLFNKDSYEGGYRRFG
jgi:hypothetical protein